MGEPLDSEERSDAEEWIDMICRGNCQSCGATRRLEQTRSKGWYACLLTTYIVFRQQAWTELEVIVEVK